MLRRSCALSMNIISRMVTKPNACPHLRNQYRTFGEEGKEAFRSRTARRRSLKEVAMQPTTGAPFAFGKGMLATAGVFGIGALCFYGLGMSNETGALEKSHLWPQYVKERIKTTYMYFGSGIAVTAASAMAAFRSPGIMSIVTKNGLMGLAICMAAIMGTGILTQTIEYKQGFGAKQMAWLLHAGVMGAMLAPMCFMGGSILIKAAWYTAGVVGGLSTIAVSRGEFFFNEFPWIFFVISW